MSETIERTRPRHEALRALPWARTPRLALREFGRDDEPALIDMHREPRLREHLVDDYPLHEPAVARFFVQRMAQLYRLHEGLGIWHAMRLQPEPRFAGWFSLMPMTGREGEVELGSRLLPHAWGCGLAMEGCELLLAHAFDTLGLPRVWGVCHRDNRSAQAVLAALGFEALGLMAYDGHDARHWLIDAPAWHACKPLPRGLRLRRALRSTSVQGDTPA